MLNPNTLPDEILPFKGKLTPRFYEVRERVLEFVVNDVVPARAIYAKQRKENVAIAPGGDELRAAEPTVVNQLRRRAKELGIFNLFLPEVSKLSVLEYAPVAEILGVFPLANAAMNCSAPDTGNMEVLEKFGTPYQRKKYLEPLLAGEIRSCFAMTEPAVASSDATQIQCVVERQPDGNYSVRGHKFYISGAIRPECKVILLLGAPPNASELPRHQRQTMILIDIDHPGVKIVRAMAVFGHLHDHAELLFDCRDVPKENIILGEGRGFEIAQARLGPGRIHHAMRTLGIAEMALDSIIHRAKTRYAFGSLLSEKESIRRFVAEARSEITAARMVCYLAACIADERGFKEARKYIAMIKVQAPRVALKIVDEAIQIHGAHGLSQDSMLTDLYASLRTLKIADGPDVVHLSQISDLEFNRKSSSGFSLGARISGTNPTVAAEAAKNKKKLNTTTSEKRSKL